MSDEVNLFAQQEANRRRSRWLVIGFILFFAWLGFGGDFIAYLATQHAPPQSYHHVFPWIGIVLTLLGAGMAKYSYSAGPTNVLRSTGAREIIDAQTPQEKQLVNVVEEMSVASGIAKPHVWIVDDPDPNAFATGHDEGDSNVAVTQGLLAICSRDELQAVIAHEMGHIKNLDVRLMTLLAALVGAVTLIADGAGRVMFNGGFGRGRRSSSDRDSGGSNPLVILLFVVWIISWILAPFITRLLAMGVNRKREYLADAMSAQFTRNPLALASALTKIESASAPTTSIKGGAAHLCIADPLGRALNGSEGKMAELFGTHPPMPTRIARLKMMGYQQSQSALAGAAATPASA
ncbi:MAG: M48 family metallopeptidase [Gemmatimonadaceae bacterium]|nr:M48 family metallopeptidase [Gemmatimonadaceae bacterium]